MVWSRRSRLWEIVGNGRKCNDACFSAAKQVVWKSANQCGTSFTHRLCQNRSEPDFHLRFPTGWFRFQITGTGCERLKVLNPLFGAEARKPNNYHLENQRRPLESVSSLLFPRDNTFSRVVYWRTIFTHWVRSSNWTGRSIANPRLHALIPLSEHQLSPFWASTFRFVFQNLWISLWKHQLNSRVTISKLVTFCIPNLCFKPDKFSIWKF